jgi:organic hydroperoxide reductase OsmC/OhrA
MTPKAMKSPVSGAMTAATCADRARPTLTVPRREETMRAFVPPIQISTPRWITHLAWTETTAIEAEGRDRGVVRLGLDGHESSYVLEDTSAGRGDDLLCAALAAGFDTTIRRVAARAGHAIERLAVMVTGDVDARGGRGEEDAPVGFQSMRVEVQLRLSSRERGLVTRTVMAAERQCVVLQTLLAAVPVELAINEGP